jgi:hypothetical protein
MKLRRPFAFFIIVAIAASCSLAADHVSFGVAHEMPFIRYPDEPRKSVAHRTKDYQFMDGAVIRVHYEIRNSTDDRSDELFAAEVLNAAVSAYQTISHFQGFSTSGYSFTRPDKKYAFDPDGVIDIYLGSVSESGRPQSTFHQTAFKDAPCFDTVKGGGHAYDAIILLPADYSGFIKNWEALNRSPLGTRNVDVDLRGTLMHEMLHVILFYYNRNLRKEEGSLVPDGSGPKLTVNRRADWYVEGLARYFEIFAGARHDFFSRGFREALPDKVRFSRGGSNFFMRYPDQRFIDLRYENALFWRYIHMRWGMEAIEKLSREFRHVRAPHFRRFIEKMTGLDFERFLKEFAVAILMKDFGLKNDTKYLEEVARTQLFYEDGSFWLTDSYGGRRLLGARCQTDWIGRWSDLDARLDEPSVAGDPTLAADVSGWATDYYEISPDTTRPELPAKLEIHHMGKGTALLVQLIIVTKGGSQVIIDGGRVASGRARDYRIIDDIAAQNLTINDIDRIFLILTNSDFERPAPYALVAGNN